MPTIENRNRAFTDLPLNSGPARGEAAPPDEVRAKADGIHYTPPLLAAYLARQVVHVLGDPIAKGGRISVLDPACGEGELLRAVVDAVPPAMRKKLLLTGFDTDQPALKRADEILRGAGVASVTLHCADFLAAAFDCGSSKQMNLGFDTEAKTHHPTPGQFDAVISNPPYVRTQVLGALAARGLAARFQLSGRVDLYHAFVKAMTFSLREGGILGLLTSNRFLSVQSGISMREWLLGNFELKRLVDLGDTKLFQAAVLPAILIACRKTIPEPRDCEFIRVYESERGANEAARRTSSILEALDGSFAGWAQVDGTCFRVETGKLQTGAGARSPWSMTSRDIESWLATVSKFSSGTFGDFGKVCVGIKTTADSVFIREDWDDLPEHERPEDELLHPLVTHHRAVRWHLPANTPNPKRVLYPYRAAGEGRTPIDLDEYPRARAYFVRHRKRLQGREYVTAGGREWYEIWVPHRPSDWTCPKIAFPDISEESRFFQVETGWIVNGDCYWTKLRPGMDPSWLSLMLAVANSTFAMRFYDAVFHNKLYSGRRRFMSQYVAKFPLPQLRRSKEILELLPHIVAASRNRRVAEANRLQKELDALVWKAFGLSPEIGR